jgi:hypothetical protein
MCVVRAHEIYRCGLERRYLPACGDSCLERDHFGLDVLLLDARVMSIASGNCGYCGWSSSFPWVTAPSQSLPR